MKFCQQHWDQLKQAVKDKGMWELVSRNGEEAAQRLTDKGPAGYDPLISAHMMIVSNALKVGGLYLMEGDLCPLCELDLNTPDKETESATIWIEHATNGALQYAREKGLVQIQ